MEYKVYFEIFGKKMQTTVYADGQESAKKLVREKIIFHKVERLPADITLENLKNFFGMK